jgi:hypothetical protein
MDILLAILDTIFRVEDHPNKNYANFVYMLWWQLSQPYIRAALDSGQLPANFVDILNKIYYDYHAAYWEFLRRFQEGPRRNNGHQHANHCCC